MADKEIKVKITADTSDLSKKLDDASDKTSGFDKKVNEFAKTLGPAMLGAAALAAGKAILDLGIKFQKAGADIAKATGKTGDELDALNKSMTNAMAVGWEQSMEDAGKAVSTLSIKLGLTGDELDKTVLLMGDFADVTNQEVGPAVDDAVTAMNKWGISASELPGFLDQILVASQKTGISAAELTAQMTQGATAFQAIGLSSSEAMAMLGSFSLNGVKTESVMAGLNKALGTFAQSGVDAAEGFKATVDGIKNAKDESEATAIALDIFGAKAGPEMAKALRSGKMSLDDLTIAIEGSYGAVKKTSDASGELADELAKASNKMQASLKPLGDVFTSIATKALDAFTIIVDSATAAGGVAGYLVGKYEKDVASQREKGADVAIATYQRMMGNQKATLETMKKDSVGITQKSSAETLAIVRAGNKGQEDEKKRSEEEKKKIQDAYDAQAILDKKNIYNKYKLMADEEDKTENDRIAQKESLHKKLAQTMQDTVKATAQFEKDASLQMVSDIEAAVSTSLELIGKIAAESDVKLSDTFNTMTSLAVNTTKAIMSGFTDTKAIIAAVSDLITLAFKGNKEKAGKFIESLNKVADILLTLLTPVLETIAFLVEAIANTMIFIGDAMIGVGKIATGVGDLIWRAFEPVRNVLQPIWDLIQSILNGIKSIGDTIGNIGNDIWNTTTGWLGFAGGTSFSPGGVAMVGEQGPEMVRLPTGSQVIPAQQTSSMSGGLGGGNTFVFNSPKQLTPIEQMRQVTQAMRTLAFEGV